MNVETVLFDLDGTLIDSAPGIHRCLSETFAHFGLPPLTDATFRPLIGPPFHATLPALVGDQDVTEVIAHYRVLYAAGGMYEASVYAGIVDLLDRLSADGVRMAVATSKLEMIVEPILRRLGILTYFETLCGHVEPDRLTKTAVVTEALRRFGDPDPGTVLMVGDRLHDVVGALANGVATLGAGWGYGAPGELAAAGALAVVDTPAEIAAFRRERRQP